MTRPLSQLVHARVQEGRGSPRIITLHRHNQFGPGLGDVARSAGPDARIIGLESYKGVFVGRSIVGYTWFVGPLHQPSPIAFGDALVEIERFLWDEIDRQTAAGAGAAELPFLLGEEQGAIMALAVAAAVPDLLSGVIAIDGVLPIVPGWEPPLAPLDGLPLLLLDAGDAQPAADHPGDGPRVPVLAGADLAGRFASWGGDVVRRVVPPGDAAGSGADRSRVIAAWLAARSPRRLAAPPS